MSEDPYPFESDDDIEIRELDLESVDAVDEDRITIGELAGENESWRYGHVIVDEAQDLTPMQWRMVMRRVRGRSLTIVGDLAQRAGPAAGAWTDLLPAELANVRRQELTVNYRSPAEIHELAVAVLSRFAPSVTPARAIRASGWAPEFRSVGSIDQGVDDAVADLLEEVGGLVAVIGAGEWSTEVRQGAGIDIESRVRFMSAVEAKGLEFDAVVLVEPSDIVAQPGGYSQLYIALTRATQRLCVVHAKPMPAVLASG